MWSGVRFEKAAEQTGRVFQDIVADLKAAGTVDLVLLENVTAVHEPPKQAKAKKDACGDVGAEPNSDAVPDEVFTNLDFCVAKLLDAGFYSWVLSLDPRYFGIVGATIHRLC